MNIKIIPEKCIACGLCHSKAPEIFDYYDNGIVKFYDSDELVKSLSETKSAVTAVKSCPTAALKIVPAPNSEKI